MEIWTTLDGKFTIMEVLENGCRRPLTIGGVIVTFPSRDAALGWIAA